ncbi:glycosyltransferase [Ideonella livida]|uniref:Glycosyltransferase family 4 protein n=1 Tax=Ideonella livida TaxID=2707176 RepID=A0A7C9PJG3_9BURK|nr:glycosyltransferase [Ideonella livida]NDY93433.1 glycosyltransferase family 4 protein [Ideonella livida]
MSGGPALGTRHARPLRLVLIGDGCSPHLLKWVRALQATQAPAVDLWVVSSRGFDPALAGCLPPARRLDLASRPRFEGGNAGLLRTLPTLVRWLRQVQPDWLAPHYLTSHGTLAWLAVRLGGVQARIAGSAWGSDILVTPRRSRLMRALTRRVLAACTLATSDSQHMTRQMHGLGAGEVLTFPFGLEQMPELAAVRAAKDDRLCFANRGLEPLYAPHRVLDAFAALAGVWPEARLVMAHDGSLRAALQARVAADPLLASRVQLVGRLDTATQAGWYARARWYFSLPQSDSVSVSVLEAMAHGCIPILSDLPANRELVQDGRNGLILADGERPGAERLAPLQARAEAIALEGHAWIGQHALFPASVQAYVRRLAELSA